MKVIVGAALVLWLLLSLRLRRHPLSVAKRLPRMLLLVPLGFFLLAVAWRLGKMSVVVAMIGGLVILIPILGIMKGKRHISS
jgi:succinate-acetate transporter protein